MKIKGVRIHITPLIWCVFGFFVLLFFASFIATKDVAFLYWGLPLCFALLLLPMVSGYSLGSQYKKLLPEYEDAAVPTRIKNINLKSMGKAVRVEGVVQKITGKFLGRPRLTIFDGSGSCIVFRSILLDEPVAIGDNIEAVGMVVKKYAVAGALSVHGVGIWKRDNAEGLTLDYADEDDETESQKSSFKIKKYN